MKNVRSFKLQVALSNTPTSKFMLDDIQECLETDHILMTNTLTIVVQSMSMTFFLISYEHLTEQMLVHSATTSFANPQPFWIAD